MNFLTGMTAAIVIGKVIVDHKLFAEKAAPYRKDIMAAALSAKVNPSIVAAICWQESKFNPNARGAAGEVGMTQFLPIALKDLSETYPNEFGGVKLDELFDARKAIVAAAYQFRSLLKRTNGDTFLALRGYNAGLSRAQSSATISTDYAFSVLGNAFIDQAWQGLEGIGRA